MVKLAEELFAYFRTAYIYYAVGIWFVGIIIGWIRIVTIRLKKNLSSSQLSEEFAELLFWDSVGALLWPIALLLGIIVGTVVGIRWLFFKANDKVVDKLKFKTVESTYSESTYREKPKKDNFST